MFQIDEHATDPCKPLEDMGASLSLLEDWNGLSKRHEPMSTTYEYSIANLEFYIFWPHFAQTFPIIKGFDGGMYVVMGNDGAIEEFLQEIGQEGIEPCCCDPATWDCTGIALKDLEGAGQC